MAWNAGRYSIGPQETVDWWYGWGDDHGSQHAQAREFRDSTRGNRLTVVYEALKRESDGQMSYFVGIRNDGPTVATCELVGGGVT
jgi:hypothetical protein